MFLYYILFSPNITLQNQSTQEHCNKLPFQSQYEVYSNSTSSRYKVYFQCSFCLVPFFAQMLNSWPISSSGWGKVRWTVVSAGSVVIFVIVGMK